MSVDEVLKEQRPSFSHEERYRKECFNAFLLLLTGTDNNNNNRKKEDNNDNDKEKEAGQVHCPNGQTHSPRTGVGNNILG